ncbi:MAG: EamA family transporter [Cyclobacteriaceae bacterium]
MPQTPSRLIPSLLAVLGVLMFSTKAVFAKLGYSYGVDAITMLVLRMLFALPIYSVIAFSFRKDKNEANGKDLIYLFLFGFIGYYLASYFDFKGLEFIKASLERLILFVYPTLVVLISFVFLGIRPTRFQLIGILVTYVGISIVFIPEINLSENHNALIGGVLVFFSALTYAGYIVGSGWLIPKFGPKRFTSYAMLISCFLVITHFMIESKMQINLLELPGPVYIYGLAMAVISTVIPSYVISYAIKGLGANQFSIFGSLGPISTIVLAYLFLGERLTSLQIAGGIVVVGGVMVAEYFKKNSGK